MKHRRVRRIAHPRANCYGAGHVNARRRQRRRKHPHQNRLAHETSPYLLQHKDNPVDWWAWGPEALAEAKRSRQADPALGRLCGLPLVPRHGARELRGRRHRGVMNELFVNIKVDREERPDIDQIYMAALHHLGEHGGWPLTMFLTPDGEPIWGGTYFPKNVALRQAGFRRRAARDRAAVPRRAAEDRAQPRRADGAACRNRAQRRRRHASARPSSTTRRGSSAASSTRSTAARAARRNFRKLRCSSCCGAPGLRTGETRYFAAVDDHAGPHLRGRHLRPSRRRFSRYSVDERWLVPHFEKMLYDNAQLLELLRSRTSAAASRFIASAPTKPSHGSSAR